MEERKGKEVSENVAQLLNDIDSSPEGLSNLVLSDDLYRELEVIGERYMAARLENLPTSQAKIEEEKQKARKIINDAPVKGL